MKTKTGYLALVGKLLRLAIKKIPKTFGLMIGCQLTAGVLQGSSVWFKQQLFDRAEQMLDGAAFLPLFIAAVFLCMILIIQLGMNAVNMVVEKSFSLKLGQIAGEVLNQKATKIAPVTYEDNRFLDKIEKAGRGTEAAVEVFQLTFSLILIIVSYFGFMGGYLYAIQPMLMVMLLLSFIPYLIGAIVRYRVHKTMENQAAPFRRRGDYYGSCLTDREYAKETRMLGGYGYFYKKMEENLSMVRKLDWGTTRKSELVDILLRFLSMAGYVGTIVLLFYYLMIGKVGIGVFAAVASSLDGMSDMLERLFNFKVGNITRKLGLAESYLDFLNLPEHIGNHPFPEAKTVEFRNVSFRYPNVLENAISQLNITIGEGETVAIVGENGSGKSTFAKLLLGIYQPVEGKVLLDGIDTRNLSSGNSDGRCSAVFQKFQKYKMTVTDNVILSSAMQNVQKSRIQEILKKAGIELNERDFPQGENTVLSREFGGTDLSGGQWQRLAIARGLYRRHNLIVLDEPTSAIDPLEETRVYKKFTELSKDKTAVIITHRLGSAKIADRILAFDGGRLVEEGTHEELMKKQGYYYEMYQAQAKWYA